MARSYAKIHVGIWNDPDFVDLDGDSQRAYLFLLSQPKMRTCGVIDMQVRRWAPKLHMTADELDAVLADLAGRNFIAIDPATEELAVRTFVKHDAGETKNWKVWIGVWSSLDAIESDMLRSFVAFNMPDGAYEPKAKPTMTRPESIDDRFPIDPVPIEEKGDVIDSQSDHQSIASGKSLATSDSVTTTTTGPQTNEPPDERPGGGGATHRADLVERAVRLLADRELETEIERGRTFTRGIEPYRNAIRQRIRTEHTAALTAIAQANPRFNDHELADTLTGPPQPILPANAPKPPEPEHATCSEPCDGHGNLIHADGSVTPHGCPGPLEVAS